MPYVVGGMARAHCPGIFIGMSLTPIWLLDLTDEYSRLHEGTRIVGRRNSILPLQMQARVPSRKMQTREPCLPLPRVATRSLVSGAWFLFFVSLSPRHSIQRFPVPTPSDSLRLFCNEHLGRTLYSSILSTFFKST